MKILVTKNKFGFSIPIKTEDYKTKEELKSFLQVKFAKCDEPATNALIEIQTSFWSNYKKRDGTIENVLIITKYNILKEYQDTNNSSQNVQQTSIQETLMPVEDDGSLPF